MVKECKLPIFLHQFQERTKNNKPFCFILGAGASKSSGIPTGGELVKDWIVEIEKIHGKEETQKWMKDKAIRKNELDRHYPAIYEKRFELRPREGYEILEELMESAEPSYGYSVLAQIITETPHKIVITTNFDSLMEDALFVYTHKRPLVIGHESLANFIDIKPKRPIIVKIHRDLFLSPKNAEDDTQTLEKSFEENLKNVFRYYTPIVIGYGGNDGSLMNYLVKLSNMYGGMFWLQRNSDRINSRIEEVINNFKGFSVSILGFDEVMIKVADIMGYEKLDANIEQVAVERAAKYRKQVETILTNDSENKDTKTALNSVIKRGKRTWWNYELMASQAPNATEAEQIYIEGLKEFPDSAELFGNYAIFLKNIKKSDNEAEKYFKLSIEKDSNHADNLGNYAIFLKNVRKNYDEAEKYYKLSIEKDPNHANTLGNYAIFLNDVRKNYDEAEKYYRLAIEKDPNNAGNLGTYAIFLKDVRKNYDEAEKYYRSAIEKDPNNAGNLGNFANFLTLIKKDYKEAEKYFKQAMEKAPNDANNIGNYTEALIELQRFTEAKEKLNRAIELNAGEKNGLEIELWFYRYAIFYKEHPESKSKIEELLKEGVRSPGWNLDGVLAVAKDLGHPDYAKLEEFAKEITKEE